MPCEKCDKCECGKPPKEECASWVTLLLDVLRDAAIIAGTYGLLALTLENTVMTTRGTLMFLGLFIPIAFVVKVVNCEYSDQLPRVALFHLSTKLFNVLMMS